MEWGFVMIGVHSWEGVLTWLLIFFFFGRLKGDWLKVSTTLRAAAGAIAHCADGL